MTATSNRDPFVASRSGDDLTIHDRYLWDCLIRTVVSRVSRSADDPRILSYGPDEPDRRRKRPLWYEKTRRIPGDLMVERWPALGRPAEGVEWDSSSRRFEVRAGGYLVAVSVRPFLWPAARKLPDDAMTVCPAEAAGQVEASARRVLTNINAAEALAVELAGWLRNRGNE